MGAGGPERAGELKVVPVDGESPDEETLLRAVALLRSGGLLIYPTDTLYALGARAYDPEACRKVRAAKGREGGKPLPVVAGDVSQVEEMCSGWPDGARVLARRFWPGPLTLVLPAGPALPPEVTAGTGAVAVRVPALAVTRRLCALAGPLVSTSANSKGRPAPATCQAAVAGVGAAAALALDAGPGIDLPSTILDLTGEEPRLVRPGAVGWDELWKVLREGGPC